MMVFSEVRALGIEDEGVAAVAIGFEKRRQSIAWRDL